MTLGGDTVLIVKRTNAAQGPLNEHVPTDDVLITVKGCSFQTQHTTEEISDTGFDSTRAKCFMPVTADTLALQPEDAIRAGGVDYELRGPRQLKTDLGGAMNHILCLVEWQR